LQLLKVELRYSAFFKENATATNYGNHRVWLSSNFSTHVDAEEAGHSVKIVLVVSHRDDLRNNVLLSPVGTELLNLNQGQKFVSLKSQRQKTAKTIRSNSKVLKDLKPKCLRHQVVQKCDLDQSGQYCSRSFDTEPKNLCLRDVMG
jgi:hypothetical protein